MNVFSKMRRPCWKKSREESKRSTDGWIRRRITRFPRQERQFQMMAINRYVPLFSQGKSRTDVIAVAMRQENRFRPRARAKPRLCRIHDLRPASGKTCIDQRPFSAGSSHEINVGKADRQPAYIGSN